MRLLKAVLLSSLSVLPLYFLVLALSGGLDHPLLVPMLLLSVGIAFAAVLLFAIPLHLLLARKAWSAWYFYVSPGFLLPAIVTYVINPLGTEVASWVKWQALVLGLLGAAVAAVFWFVASRVETR